MGDRANIAIISRDEKSAVFLYSHWAGKSLYNYAAQALDSAAARDRWNDNDYLTRILFHQILEDHADSHESTGWGISTQCGDYNYDTLVIDPNTQAVDFRNPNQAAYTVGMNSGITFEDFIQTYKKA